MLPKYRTAMVRPDRDGLQGRVEVDETFLGAMGRTRLTVIQTAQALRGSERRMWRDGAERSIEPRSAAAGGRLAVLALSVPTRLPGHGTLL